MAALLLRDFASCLAALGDKAGDFIASINGVPALLVMVFALPIGTWLDRRAIVSSFEYGTC